MELALAVVGAAVLVFWPLVVCGALLHRLAGRYRRRGGGLRLAASNGSRVVTTRTTDGTRLSVAYSNSRSLPGDQSAVMVTRRFTPRRSSATGRIYYGDAAGAGDSPGQRQGLAG